jgi:hypothetical protein
MEATESLDGLYTISARLPYTVAAVSSFIFFLILFLSRAPSLIHPQR